MERTCHTKFKPSQFTRQNQLPNVRSRTYLTNYLRQRRLVKSSSPVRASLGFLRWMISKKHFQAKRRAVRTVCFLSGRTRGTSQRFTISRVKIKENFALNLLIGVRKSSF